MQNNKDLVALYEANELGRNKHDKSVGRNYFLAYGAFGESFCESSTDVKTSVFACFQKLRKTPSCGALPLRAWKGLPADGLARFQFLEVMVNCAMASETFSPLGTLRHWIKSLALGEQVMKQRKMLHAAWRVKPMGKFDPFWGIFVGSRYFLKLLFYFCFFFFRRRFSRRIFVIACAEIRRCCRTLLGVWSHMAGSAAEISREHVPVILNLKMAQSRGSWLRMVFFFFVILRAAFIAHPFLFGQNFGTSNRSLQLHVVEMFAGRVQHLSEAIPAQHWAKLEPWQWTLGFEHSNFW